MCGYAGLLMGASKFTLRVVEAAQPFAPRPPCQTEPALNSSVSTSFVPPADWGRGLGLVLPSPSQPASLGESIWDREILEEGEVCQALSEHHWSCTSCLRNHQVVCLGRRGRAPGLGAGSEEGIGVQKSIVEPCTVLAGGVTGHRVPALSQHIHTLVA